jgi:hypothetical protein
MARFNDGSTTLDAAGDHSHHSVIAMLFPLA